MMMMNMGSEKSPKGGMMMMMMMMRRLREARETETRGGTLRGVKIL